MLRATPLKVAGAALLSASLLAAQGAAAQDNPPAEGGLVLELNELADNDAGGCRMTVVTTNRLSQGIRRAAWQVAIFDASGAVRSLPVLDFGTLIAGKTKVAIFEIPGGGCDSISRIVVNDVAECTAEDDSDLGATCLTSLATRNRSNIEFGI